MKNNKTQYISKSQKDFLNQLAIDMADIGIDINIPYEAKKKYNKPIDRLTMLEASTFIDYILAEKRYLELNIDK